jgi:rhomboid family GlyGly-CTERM serine protease
LFKSDYRENRKSVLKIPLPNITILIVAASLIAFFLKDVGYYAIYNRPVIFSGQIWRLWTCHAVHETLHQLIYDLVPFLIAGGLIERKKFPFFISLCLITMTAVSALVFFFYPNIQYFGGLSGLAMASIIYLCLYGFKNDKSWRWLYSLVLLGAFTAIGLEIAHGKSLGALENETYFLVPSIHITGTVTALFIFLFFKKRE